jgi:hypothetical protein
MWINLLFNQLLSRIYCTNQMKFSNILNSKRRTTYPIHVKSIYDKENILGFSKNNSN